MLRRRCPPSRPGIRLLGPFEHRFSPSLAAVVVARHLFEEWLRFQAVDDVEREDLLVIASELCTNAVRAASGAHVGVALRAWAKGSDLILEVQDDGHGFDVAVPAGEERPPAEQHSGRGLFLVQSMVDDFAVSSSGQGTTVRCVKRYLFPEGAAAPRSPG